MDTHGRLSRGFKIVAASSLSTNPLLSILLTPSGAKQPSTLRGNHSRARRTPQTVARQMSRALQAAPGSDVSNSEFVLHKMLWGIRIPSLNCLVAALGGVEPRTVRFVGAGRGRQEHCYKGIRQEDPLTNPLLAIPSMSPSITSNFEVTKMCASPRPDFNFDQRAVTPTPPNTKTNTRLCHHMWTVYSNPEKQFLTKPNPGDTCATPRSRVAR